MSGPEDQAADMTPDVPQARSNWGIGRTLHTAFATKVGWWPRAGLPIGFLCVAIQDNTWLALAMAAVWSLNVQLIVVAVHMRGWTEGVDWLEALDGEHSVNLSMVEFMNFCDEHDVPPQDIARLMWKKDE